MTQGLCVTVFRVTLCGVPDIMVKHKFYTLLTHLLYTLQVITYTLQIYT